MKAIRVIQVVDRPREGKADFILAHGQDGRERVRVVLTKANTFACMTCLTVDCAHAEIAARHYATHGVAQPAPAMEGAA
jgi:hypothetical protein